MTDTSMQPDNSDQENKLTSAQFDEFKEALEVLYVIANLSARIQFAKNWPAAADFVLGKDLMHYDDAGASPEDKEDRAELEQEAEAKRIALLEFMDTLEEKSVEKGALQIEYVKEAMGKLGRPLSLLIYGEKLVDRFLPLSPEEIKAAAEQAESTEGAETTAASVAVAPEPSPAMPDAAAPPTSPVAGAQPPVNPDGPVTVNPDNLSSDLDDALTGDIAGAPNIHHDPMDDVKPIDFEEPAPPKPTPSLEDQPVGADPSNPVAPAEEPEPVPPLTAPPPVETPPAESVPQTMDKSEVAGEAAPSVPTLEEETANPMEEQQAMVENTEAMTPAAPEAPQDVPPLTPPPPPPPPVAPQAPTPLQQEEPMEMRPRGEVPSAPAEPSVPPPPPPQAPSAPSPLTSPTDQGAAQKPVAMKFVSSKDKTPDDTNDGDGETNQG